MKQFLIFIQKEFFHVLRDKRTLLILFGLPIAQIIIFGFALTNEVKNAKIAVVDYANDALSTRLLHEIDASQYFDIERRLTSAEQIESAFQTGRVKVAIVLPSNLAQSIEHTHQADIQIIADASDPNTASTLTAYLSAIIGDFQNRYLQNMRLPYTITTETAMLYNPQLRGAHNFVPGVMALVLMLICVMMTAISIVREKETGTMEILLVSPFRPILVILSKAIPYLILSLVNVVSILLLSTYVLDLPIKGSLLLLFAESVLFIITSLSIGLLISVRVATQQTAMLISMMGMLLPTLLFSGFMFPIENMPLPLQIVSNIVPAKWYYFIVKSVMIKGLAFADIWRETLILAGMTLFFILVSLKNFKTRLA